MRPVVEALMRVNNSYEKVTFGSLKRGNQPGLTNVKGKTQMILVKCRRVGIRWRRADGRLP